MTRLRVLGHGAVAALVAVSFFAGPGADKADTRAPKGPAAPAAASEWVNTWTAMPQLTEPGNMPPAPFTAADGVLDDSTLRQTIHVSIGGERLRLRFSNAFGGAALPITRAAVSLPAGGQAGVSAIQPGTSRPVTFSGRPSTVIPNGAQVVSDPVTLDVARESNLTVTIYLADGQASQSITSHPGSRTTSYLVRGDRTEAVQLNGATSTDHWYFLSGAEVTAPPRANAVAVLGDSLTDGRGSTTNANNRWPDRLAARLGEFRPTAEVAVLNQAAGGNRVLNDGLGPNVLARLDRDVLAQSDVSKLIVFEGINDIGTAEPTTTAQAAVTDQLLAAYDQIITRAHAAGITVYGATLTPLGGSFYDDPDGTREAARQAVNQWIRTSDRFDAVVDLDRVARDAARPTRLNPSYDTGDHLHLNPDGYHALGDAFPLKLFDRP
jgi:lysophospholipase L1-like esterase